MASKEDETEPFSPKEETIAAIKLLKKKKVDDENLIDALHQLLNEGKGHATVKDFIGEQNGAELVKLSSHRNKEVSIAAAKVLRSITVHRNNKKRFKKHCINLLNNLKNAVPKARVPLTAVIWNLSSISSNREELLKADALPVLVSLLEEGGELQGEAAGALRNFTLDENLFPELSSTKLIVNMVTILASVNPSEVNKMVWNILDSFENLAAYEPNHKKLGSKESIAVLSAFLRNTQAQTFQKFVLTIFYHLSTNEEMKTKLLKRKVDALLLETIENAPEETLLSACQEVLLHIQEDTSELRKKIRKAKQKNRVLQNYALEVENLLRTAAGCDPIKEKNITFTAELGEGSFGAVYLAEYQGFPVAVKFLKYELSEKGVNKVLDELKIMRKLKHPNIVLLMGAAVDSHNQIMILTEYASRGDLKSCLGELDSLAIRMRLAHDLANGLNWCHYHYVTHRDLKLENIFITENWGLKIGDFGLAIQDKEGKGWHNFRGNVKYSAPELLRERALREQGPRVFGYGVKTDVYSFGLLWYEILTRLSPFKDKPEEYKGREGQARYTLEGHRPTPPLEWPPLLKKVMISCWAEDPNERPTFEEVLAQWNRMTIKFLCPEDKAAKNLIKDLWKDQSKKPGYGEFKEAFIKHCLVDSKLMRKDDMMLEELCRESVLNPCVSFEQFCHVVGWYGPLDLGTNCADFFARIKEFKSKLFFRGTEPSELSDKSLKAALLDAKENSKESGGEYNSDSPHTSEDNRFFLLKYSVTTIGEFQLRYIDEQGDISTISIRNVNGSLKIDDLILSNWSKLRSTLKKTYHLKYFPKY